MHIICKKIYLIIIFYAIIKIRVGEILKKIFAALLIMILLTGCVKVSNKSINDFFETVLYVDNGLSNTYMDGYSFYLPQGLKIINKSDYNLVIQDNNQKYYLYIDTIAYYYNTSNLFTENNSHFYSKKFNYNQKSGYVDIIDNENNYFVVIMYNYAKIEAYIDKESFNKSLISIFQILSTIKYNDAVISNYVGNKGVTYQEEKFNIFSTEVENDNFLKYEAEYGTYKSPVNKNDDVIDVEEVIE